MSTSPIVAEQLHTHNTTFDADPIQPDSGVLPHEGQAPGLKATVELPSLNLTDPIGTTVRMPLPANPALKIATPVPITKTSPPAFDEPLDNGLAARLTQLRSTSTDLRTETQAVRRKTGSIS